ncbi:phospholipid carrier-dependent glycosyltransferase [Arthrobacter sp. I2-34]|uniref:Polyprenol-phosphate-mannose--protein mannosyltransferase n=1 Tax=Arthrobacter hankyongi TaxID=2904801 RepID=A0ABS9L1N3_9MICC|nr:phospholipid carrier-dependent glycosyltransferase [Arthrobacter hankyongi]MCG2620580.1 phospholipid carrier-dependent glycosyltransferase [Arthrobacter hankyongi]
MTQTDHQRPPTPAATWLEPPQRAFSAAVLRRRLAGPPLPWGLWDWLLPLLAALLGGVLRFYRLGQPGSLVFDETYYVKDAFSYLVSGYEREWPEDANTSFNAGNPDVLLGTPEYVVHPPVGKWMIAFGMWLFGPDNAFGWRFAAAATGTISILLIALIARKLFRSAALGGIAGLLTAVDGHHLVQSRTSLLDIFLMFWVLAAFGALLLDRDDGRRRLAGKVAARTGPSGVPAAGSLLAGPLVLWRPWRLAAGVCLGLAVGTKWSALAFVAVFGLLTVLWDINARRVAGVRGWFSAGVLRDGVPAFFTLIPVAAATYLATWTGWFLSTDAYDRQWAATHRGGIWDWLPGPLRSLAEYHRSAYAFHNGLNTEHPYESSPWSWLLLGRPTSFYYQGDDAGQHGCTVPGGCSAAVTVLGNPIIWWAAALALLVLVFYWIGRRDWRAGAVLSGVAAGYLPWFLYPDRTMFYFYAIVFEPFLILALTYTLGLMIGPPSAPPWRRHRGILAAGLFLALALGAAAFFLPVWTAEQIPYEHWRWRMWMPSWI